MDMTEHQTWDSNSVELSLFKPKAQLLLRWLRTVAQLEFLLSSGVSLFNAFFFSKYCHKPCIAKN